MPGIPGGAAHAALRRVPASSATARAVPRLTPPPQAFILSLRPRASTFLAALRSRSWMVPHDAHAHTRTFSALGPSLTPQAEHTWLVGSNRPVFPKTRPYRAALYSSIRTNPDHPASWTLFASRVLASPATHKFSTYTAWLSRMICVEDLWQKSARLFATLTCARASRTRDFSMFLLPFTFRLC